MIKLRPKNVAATSATGEQGLGACPAAQSSQLCLLRTILTGRNNLTFRELQSLKWTLCPILNQITGEQAANYKTSGILIYLRYVKFSPAHQSTGEELLNHLTKISCESVKRGKLRHRMPGGFWSGSRWKALPEGGIPQVPRVIPAHKLSSLSPGHQGSQTPHIH